jgi:DNA-directed RNA polymerase subunit RPC12/RpoP
MEEEVTCPYCHSDNVYKNRYSIQKIALCILLLGFPILFGNTKYHCFDCGKEFSLKNSHDETAVS